MSIQSDVESLSIQALENYAKIHNLSENDAIDETSVVDFIVLYQKLKLKNGHIVYICELFLAANTYINTFFILLIH